MVISEKSMESDKDYIVQSRLLFPKGARKYNVPPLLYLISIGLAPNILYNLDAESTISLLRAFPELEDDQIDIGIYNLGQLWYRCQEKVPVIDLFKVYLQSVCGYHMGSAKLEADQLRHRYQPEVPPIENEMELYEEVPR